MDRNEVPLNHCKHFVERKRRYCKMTLKRGFEYCGEHLPEELESYQKEEEVSKTIRIACPLDPKHTCFAFKLDKHLKICNARPQPLPYISTGINCGDNSSNITENVPTLNTRQLSVIPVENLKVLIVKINNIYAEYIDGKIEKCISTCSIVERELRRPDYGPKTKKHLTQTSSILGILKSKQLLQNDTTYIEFGAGKGQLSYWLSQEMQNLNLENSSVVLVDRASHRHKFDNKIEKRDNAVHRIKADIGDLLLHQIDVIKTSKRIVGVTKHLCGEATDLALRCLETFITNGGVVSGVVMTFCCHHRCQWSSYVGKQFLNQVKLNRLDFDAICGMVSWAVCGSGLRRDNAINADLIPRDKDLGYSHSEKEEIGRKCKNILNFGRMQYFQSLRFDCSLNYYVESSYSPENVCIIATVT